MFKTCSSKIQSSPGNGVRPTVFNKYINVILILYSHFEKKCFRVHKIVVDGDCSRPTPIRSRVPQGTVLGPQMFVNFYQWYWHHTLAKVALEWIAESVVDAQIYITRSHTRKNLGYLAWLLINIKAALQPKYMCIVEWRRKRYRLECWRFTTRDFTATSAKLSAFLGLPNNPYFLYNFSPRIFKTLA